MLDWAEYTKFFLALLVIVNPLGTVPLFVSMTAGDSLSERKHIARVASLAVGIVLVVSALAGQYLRWRFSAFRWRRSRSAARS
jgi:multiple antibiotic resistance protein